MATALLGGHIKGWAGAGSHVQFVKDGTMRLLLSFNIVRMKAAPDIPTVFELYLKEYSLGTPLLIIGPKGLPEPIWKKLENAYLKAMKDPCVSKVSGSISSFLRSSMVPRRPWRTWRGSPRAGPSSSRLRELRRRNNERLSLEGLRKTDPTAGRGVMKRYDRICSVICLVFAGIVIWLSFFVPMGRISKPGPHSSLSGWRSPWPFSPSFYGSRRACAKVPRHRCNSFPAKGDGPT